jgi:hypothetical protein
VGIVFPLRNNSSKNVPLENLLKVIKLVDPGDNPFMFPSSDLHKTLSQNIPVGNLVPSSNTRHSNPSNSSNPLQSTPKHQGLQGPMEQGRSNDHYIPRRDRSLNMAAHPISYLEPSTRCLDSRNDRDCIPIRPPIGKMTLWYFSPYSFSKT